MEAKTETLTKQTSGHSVGDAANIPTPDVGFVKRPKKTGEFVGELEQPFAGLQLMGGNSIGLLHVGQRPARPARLTL
jgi:hypothetical protein